MTNCRFSSLLLIGILFLSAYSFAGEPDGFIPEWQTHITDNYFFYKPIEYSGCVSDSISQRVFVTNKNGEILSLNSKTGEIEWRVALKHPIHRKPLFSKGILYAANTGGEISAIDVSGKRPETLWKREISGGIISDITEDEGRLFLLTERNILYSIDTKDGKILYQINNDFNEGFTVYTNTPVIVEKDKIVYTVSTGQLFVLQRDDGRLLYKIDIFNTDEKIDGFTGLNLQGGYIILSTLSGFLYRIQLVDGKILWSRVLSQIITTRTDKESGNIFLFHSDGTIAVYDSEGRLLRKKLPLKRKILGADILGQRLIVRYSEGEILSFAKEDLSLFSYIRLSAPVFAEIGFEQNYAYIFSSKGSLIKFLIK